MANKPTPADFSPTVPNFPVIGQYQPVYGKFDLTTYIQGASDYEIMAFLVQCYNATLKGYSDVTQLSKDTVTAYNQLQTWVNTWFAELDVQQEINNKLQSMYEAGTLANAIAQSGSIPPAVTQYLNSEEGTQNLSRVTADKIDSMATDGSLADVIAQTNKIPDAVKQYLDSIDGTKNLSNVTAKKIEEMAATGTLGTVINKTGTVQSTTTNWLQQNVTPTGSAVVVDKSLTIEGAAADSKAVGNNICSLKKDLTEISEQKSDMDGITNLFNWVNGAYNVESNRLVFNANNKHAIATPNAVSVKNASYIKISDFETYKYSFAITYGTDNWYYTSATSNPFNIPKNVTAIVVTVARRDNEVITGSDLASVSCAIISDNKFNHLVTLTELFSMPKTIESIIENTQTDTSADAFLINKNVSMDTNTAKGLFSKRIGGIGSITFTDWLTSEQLSNTFNVQQDNDYIYKCMHFPHDGTYPNLEEQDPNIINVEPLPLKLPIGAIYLNTDVADEFNGLIRIIAFNMFGYKNGHWYEIDNSNISWAQIYELPWGTSGGTNIPFTYQHGTVLINLVNQKLTKDNVLHFGTRNTYATGFDYYIVKAIVKCNKASCGLKISVDSRDDISGSPTQIINSRTFALPNNTVLTAFAHNIPDSVYSNVITNFDNYVRLKVPHYYCGRVQINGFIINLLKGKNSVTTIKDLYSDEEVKIIINDKSVNTSDNNNLIVVTEHSTRIDVTAKKDIFLSAIVSNTDAVANYNFDLI